MQGQRCKGVAVDCVNFIAAVFDEMSFGPLGEGQLFKDLRVSPWEDAAASIRDAMREYPCTPVDAAQTVAGAEYSVQTGDVVVAFVKAVQANHALVVGEDCLWHASAICGKVEKTLLNAYSRNLRCVLRYDRRSAWKR